MPAKKIEDHELLKQLAHGGRTVTELAEFFDVATSTISRRLNRLKQRGIAKVEAQETLTRRWTKLGNYKIYTLTDAGKMALRGGEPHPLTKDGKNDEKQRHESEVSLDDFTPRMREPQTDVHGIQFKIPITGDRGEIPCRLRKQKMRNWTKYHGNINGSYICITPSHILLWPRARGDTVEDALDDLRDTVEDLWMTFRHDLGWEIDSDLVADNRITGAKYGAVHVDAFRGMQTPAEGRMGVVDDTPEYGTFHPKGDEEAQRFLVDTVVEDARWRMENRDKIVTEDQLEALAGELVNVVEDRVVSGLLSKLQQRGGSGGPGGAALDRAADDDAQDDGEVPYHG